MSQYFNWNEFHFDPDNTFAASWHYPAAGAAGYLALLYILSVVLKKEVASKSTFMYIEVVHNLVLIVLSIFMGTGAIIGAFERASNEGIGELFCTTVSPDRIWDGKLGYFTYVFYLSKYYELLDTVILSFRKKKIIPLQVWHHASMLFVTWSWFRFPWLEGSWWCTFGE